MSELELQSDGLEDDGAGYLISVSDIMSGLLFVFLITLVAFVINFRVAIDDLSNSHELRRELLEHIEMRLSDYGIRVEVDFDNGVLRLTESTISFPSGKADLSIDERAKLAHIGEVLAEVLPCYSAHQSPSCDSRTKGKLEAVFVEGHTDNVPLTSGRFRDNWDLSAQRAMQTYRLLMETQPALSLLVNDLEQPLFSVSGYGDGRPVVEHAEPTSEPRNRRIDLRFIMASPTASVEPEPIRVLRERGVR